MASEEIQVPNGDEKKFGMTDNDTAAIALTCLGIGLILGAGDLLSAWLMRPGTYDMRILPACAAIAFFCGLLASANHCRFRMNLVLPSPFHGVLFFALATIFEIARTLQAL